MSQLGRLLRGRCPNRARTSSGAATHAQSLSSALTHRASHVASRLPPSAVGRILDRNSKGSSEQVGQSSRLRLAGRTKGPTWEFNPESGALACDALRCDALSGALDVALFASSGTVWSRDLQASRGQWPPPAVRERRANPFMMLTFYVRRSPGDSAAATGWSQSSWVPFQNRSHGLAMQTAGARARRGTT